MSETNCPSVAVYEVYVVGVILLFFMCMRFCSLLPSSSVGSSLGCVVTSISVHKIN